LPAALVQRRLIEPGDGGKTLTRMAFLAKRLHLPSLFCAAQATEQAEKVRA